MYKSLSQALKMFSQLASAGKAGTGKAALVWVLNFSRHVQQQNAGPRSAQVLAALMFTGLCLHLSSANVLFAITACCWPPAAIGGTADSHERNVATTCGLSDAIHDSAGFRFPTNCVFPVYTALLYGPRAE